MAEVKKALTEASGDQAMALEALIARGGDIAAKKAGRELKAGVVDAYVHNNKQSGAMVELLCETDFVARTDEFLALAHDIAMHVTAMKPTNLEELLAQPFIKNPEQTVSAVLTAAIAKIGENIQISKFEVFQI